MQSGNGSQYCQIWLGIRHETITVLIDLNFLLSPLTNICQIQIDSDSVYWACSQKAKNQKAKQTAVHFTTKQYNTRVEMVPVFNWIALLHGI